MKKLFLLSTLALLTVFCYSQNHVHQFKYLLQDQQGWLLDSTFYYESNVDQEYQYFSRIKQRTISGLPLFQEIKNFNYITHEYEFAFSVQYDYVIENDTNEIFEIWVIDHEGTLDSSRHYTHHNDNGYTIKSNEQRNNHIWGLGSMRKTKHINDPHIYHQIEYRRENENQIWDLYSENKSYYNPDTTQLHSFIYYSSPSFNDTVEKSIYYFNEQHLIYKTEEYKNQNGLWILGRKTINTYDLNHNLILEEAFILSDDLLINEYKKVKSYDEYGFLNSSQVYYWDINNQIWEYLNRIDFVNDIHGNALTEITFIDIYDTSWVQLNKWENTFNAHNQLINSKQFLIDSDSIWIPTINNTTVYYNSESISSYTTEVWDSATNDYKGLSKREYTYNENDQWVLNNFFLFDDLDYQWVLITKNESIFTENESQKIIERISTDYPQWDTVSIYNRFYNKSTTGISALPIHEYLLYPNPATNQIKLNSERYRSQNIKYEIYNSTGLLMGSGTMNAIGCISIDRFTQGQYLLKVYKPNGQTEVLKFIKQ